MTRDKGSARTVKRDHNEKLETVANSVRASNESALTFGTVCLLTFCFVTLSHKLPLAEVGAAGAILVALARYRLLVVPKFYRWYLLYIGIGVIGLSNSLRPSIVAEELVTTLKFTAVGFAALNILITRRQCRLFVLCYLLMFALYPIRGAIYNYLHGITQFGRISWNFTFRNPNDLGITCFLPLGLCTYLLFTDKGLTRMMAGIGACVLMSVLMLTQSRGAMLGLAGGILYFAMQSGKPIRMLVQIGAIGLLAVFATPNGVWNRLAGLSNASVTDMSKVDPEGSASGRWQVMQIAFHIAEEHPFLGVGLGTYSLAHADYAAATEVRRADVRVPRDAHCMYVRAAAETGFGGAMCIILFVSGCLLYCRRGRKQLLIEGGPLSPALAILALEASMVAFAIAAVFNSTERSTFFMWQMVVPWSLATVLVRTARTRPSLNAGGNALRM